MLDICVFMGLPATCVDEFCVYRRATASTAMNAISSRSHAILIVAVYQQSHRDPTEIIAGQRLVCG